MNMLFRALGRNAFGLVIVAIAICSVTLLSGCTKDRSWKVGERAPEISVLDLEDRTVKLSDFKGKAVVLRFWATGCQACVAGMPVLDRSSRQYRDRGLAVLAVNMANPKALVETFAKGLKLSYPVLLDPALIAAKKYGVKSVPTTYFIDKKGIAVKAVVGDVTQEQFEKTVDELM